MTPKPSPWIATLPIFCGLLLGLSFPSVDWHLFAWIALVPLAWCWTQPQLPRSAYWSAYAGGVLFHLVALDWIRHCYLKSQASFGPYTDGWVILCLFNGLLFLSFFGYGRWLTRATRLPMTLVLPVAWVTFELARHHVGTLIDQTGFPWAKLAITQADWLVLIQVADLGGEYLVSFLLAMVSGAIVDVLPRARCGPPPRRKTLRGGEPPLAGRVVGPVGASVLLIAVVAYGNWRMEEARFLPGPTVCLIGKHDTPTSMDRNQIATETDCRPDLLLWPELALRTHLIDVREQAEGSTTQPPLPLDVAAQVESNFVDHAETVRSGLITAAHKLEATLLVGCERLEPGSRAWRRYNSMVCVDPQLGIVECYDKCYPVPWAEFMPYMTDRADSEDEDNFRRGKGPAQFSIRARADETVYQCRPVLCYDLCFASFFRREAPGESSRHAVDFFVHSGSEGQDRTGVLAETMLRAARFRAIETRRAIVRNVTHGTSGILDSNGRLQIVVSGTVVKRPVVLGTVPIDRRHSVYSRVGDWPLILVCAMFAIGGKTILAAGGSRGVSRKAAASACG